ncbi:MAG: hypothetical protein PF542_05570 [Nanoarchaeota archaeon]|jgi:hypothetical protein|nr:hypothetical protein [Nanoarchaeota archaeon]
MNATTIESKNNILHFADDIQESIGRIYIRVKEKGPIFKINKWHQIIPADSTQGLVVFPEEHSRQLSVPGVYVSSGNCRVVKKWGKNSATCSTSSWGLVINQNLNFKMSSRYWIKKTLTNNFEAYLTNIRKEVGYAALGMPKYQGKINKHLEGFEEAISGGVKLTTQRLYMMTSFKSVFEGIKTEKKNAYFELSLRIDLAIDELISELNEKHVFNF